MTWFNSLKAGLIITTCTSFSALAQDNLSVLNYWKLYDGGTKNSLYKHLSTTAFQQLDERILGTKNLKTKIDWQKRQTQIKSKLKVAIGDFPEKTPLNPVITGKIQKQDFTVEKLYFESRPGYLVTAALFLPNNKNEKLPTIIYCSGHSENGFRSDAYQKIILNYVKKGFAVFAFDPIGQGERKQYMDGVVGKSPTKEHSYPGAQSFITGLPIANYFIWDGIRSVDYLLTRKEIDPHRIGIAGRSGGGTQAAYIAAMDDRIFASAPECYITTFQRLIQSKGPQDAEQNLMHGLKNGIDITDYLIARAPKPTLLVTTTNDIFSIQGAREAFQEAQKTYSIFGKNDQIKMVEDDAEHTSTTKNRTASYAFFQQYLNNPGSSEDLDVTLFAEEELYVLPNGLMKPDQETLFSLTKNRSEKIIAKKEQMRISNTNYSQTLVAQIKNITGYEQPKMLKESIFSGRIHRDHYAIEKYLIKGIGDYYVPTVWFKPKNSNGKQIFLLDDRGKEHAGKQGELADKLAHEGYEIILADLNGVGELSNGYIDGGDSNIDNVPLNLWFMSILTKKSLVAVRTEEIAIITDFIKKNSAHFNSLSALASGTLTSDLLHASNFKEKAFDQIILINPLTSYASITATEDYKTKFIPSAVAASIATYDLPDLVDLFTGKVLIINPVNAKDENVDSITAQQAYSKRINQKVDSSKLDLRVDITPEKMAQAVVQWMK